MRKRLQKLGALLFIALVVCLPLFEIVEGGEDLREGGDFVQLILAAMTLGTVVILMSRVTPVLVRRFTVSQVFVAPLSVVPQPVPEIEASPPELFLTVHVIRI